MNHTRDPLIVVGVDGSEPSQEALRWAAQQAQVTGAELVAVIVWHLPEVYGYVGRDYDEDARNVFDRRYGLVFKRRRHRAEPRLQPVAA